MHNIQTCLLINSKALDPVVMSDLRALLEVDSDEAAIAKAFEVFVKTGKPQKFIKFSNEQEIENFVFQALVTPNLGEGLQVILPQSIAAKAIQKFDRECCYARSAPSVVIDQLLLVVRDSFESRFFNPQTDEVKVPLITPFQHNLEFVLGIDQKTLSTTAIAFAMNELEKHDFKQMPRLPARLNRKFPDELRTISIDPYLLMRIIGRYGLVNLNQNLATLLALGLHELEARLNNESAGFVAQPQDFDELGFWLLDNNFDRSRFSDFNVPEEATKIESVAKAFYKDLAQKYHPDKRGTEMQMSNLSRLYDQLMALVEMNGGLGQ